MASPFLPQGARAVGEGPPHYCLTEFSFHSAPSTCCSGCHPYSNPDASTTSCSAASTGSRSAWRYGPRPQYKPRIEFRTKRSKTFDVESRSFPSTTHRSFYRCPCAITELPTATLIAERKVASWFWRAPRWRNAARFTFAGGTYSGTAGRGSGIGAPLAPGSFRPVSIRVSISLTAASSLRIYSEFDQTCIKTFIRVLRLCRCARRIEARFRNHTKLLAISMSASVVEEIDSEK